MIAASVIGIGDGRGQSLEFRLTLGGGHFTIGAIAGAFANSNGGIQILLASVRARPRGRV